nr:uncharacterized protein LOC113812848 [Penaeus vannamei]
MSSSESLAFFELLLRWGVLCLVVLLVDSAQVCQEVNVTCKTLLPISEEADHLVALVGVLPRQGVWGVHFELEREKQVLASFNMSRTEGKRGTTITYSDHLAVSCRNRAALEVPSPWPEDWFLCGVKFILFNISQHLIRVSWKADSAGYQDLATDVCNVNYLSDVSFSASSLRHLPTPMLSLRCADEEPGRSADEEPRDGSESESAVPPVFQLCVAGLIVLLALVLSAVDLFLILSLRKRLLTPTMTAIEAVGDDYVPRRRKNRMN